MDIADELPVDLDDVEEEILQMTKRGKPGAKVIQRKGDPLALQIIHKGADNLGDQHGRAFGDFQNQPLANCW